MVHIYWVYIFSFSFVFGLVSWFSWWVSRHSQHGTAYFIFTGERGRHFYLAER